MAVVYNLKGNAEPQRCIHISRLPVAALCIAITCTGALAAGPEAPFLLAQGRVTKEQATETALKTLPGKVTDFTIERKRGKEVYVIEIVADKDGSENDVLVDMTTGVVIGIDK